MAGETKKKLKKLNREDKLEEYREKKDQVKNMQMPKAFENVDVYFEPHSSTKNSKDEEPTRIRLAGDWFIMPPEIDQNGNVVDPRTYGVFCVTAGATHLISEHLDYKKEVLGYLVIDSEKYEARAVSAKEFKPEENSPKRVPVEMMMSFKKTMPEYLLLIFTLHSAPGLQ